MAKKKKKTTIGEMTNSRKSWGFDASTRVVENKKGKGSFKREKAKKNIMKYY